MNRFGASCGPRGAFSEIDEAASLLEPVSLSPGYLKRFHLVKKHFKRLNQCGAFESLRRPRPGAQASVHPAPLPTANRGLGPLSWVAQRARKPNPNGTATAQTKAT